MNKTLALCFLLGAAVSPARAETRYFLLGDGDTITEYASVPTMETPAVTVKGVTKRPPESLDAATVSQRPTKTASPSWSVTPTLSLVLLIGFAVLGLAASGRRARKQAINVFD